MASFFDGVTRSDLPLLLIRAGGSSRGRPVVRNRLRNRQSLQGCRSVNIPLRSVDARHHLGLIPRPLVDVAHLRQGRGRVQHVPVSQSGVRQNAAIGRESGKRRSERAYSEACDEASREAYSKM
eukprot:2066227-Pleurochrysis_carterae.AAC.1